MELLTVIVYEKRWTKSATQKKRPWARRSQQDIWEENCVFKLLGSAAKHGGGSFSFFSFLHPLLCPFQTWVSDLGHEIPAECTFELAAAESAREREKEKFGMAI